MKQLLPQMMAHPFAGQGFDGYWDVRVPHFASAMTVLPHSLHVLTLVKVGAIGRALLLSTAASAFVFLLRARRSVEPASDPLRYVLLTLGVAILPATAALLDAAPVCFCSVS